MNLTRVAMVVLAGGLGVLGPVGCGGGEETGAERSPAAGPAEPEVREVEYTVRGVVERMPGAMNELLVRHEAIPEFDTGRVDDEGTPVLGMNVMSMEFPAGEGYDYRDLSVGDKVALTFAVRHDAEDNSLVGWELVSHEVLPDETELNFTPLDELRDGGDESGGGGS